MGSDVQLCLETTAPSYLEMYIWKESKKFDSTHGNPLKKVDVL